MDDYIDPDVAYFLGLVTARGELSDSGGVKRITIEFPFRNQIVEGIEKKIEQKDQILLGLDKAINRINELTDINIRKNVEEHSVFLILESLKSTLFWRNVNLLMKRKKTYYEFEIPNQIFDTDDDQIKKEFIRGFSDVAGSARFSNRNKWGKCRVYLDVLNSPQSWNLPVQLCYLLQDHLKIPVDTIAWGHPNIRDPKQKEYKAGKKDVWAREHQIKIFTDDFEKIGFYLPHKQEILQELADYNRKEKFSKASFCKPPKRLTKQKKSKHPAEKSDKLPAVIRGKHFDSYWQICTHFNCQRYMKFLKNQKRLSTH